MTAPGVSPGPRRARAALAATVLIVLGVAAGHIGALPSTLEDIDSVNFALGVRDFNPARHRPHPPGYPVYIALGKASAAITRTVWPDGRPDRIEARALSALSLRRGPAADVAHAESVRGLLRARRRWRGRPTSHAPRARGHAPGGDVPTHVVLVVASHERRAGPRRCGRGPGVPVAGVVAPIPGCRRRSTFGSRGHGGLRTRHRAWSPAGRVRHRVPVADGLAHRARLVAGARRSRGAGRAGRDARIRDRVRGGRIGVGGAAARGERGTAGLSRGARQSGRRGLRRRRHVVSEPHAEARGVHLASDVRVAVGQRPSGERRAGARDARGSRLARTRTADVRWLFPS